MKNRPQGNAGGACGTSGDYHDQHATSVIPYLEVPPHITGQAQALAFDSEAAEHTAVYCRRVIANEFHIKSVTDGQRLSNPTAREVRLFKREIYARMKAIRAEGFTPVVLVESLPGGLRKRELVAGQRWTDYKGVEA